MISLPDVPPPLLLSWGPGNVVRVQLWPPLRVSLLGPAHGFPRGKCKTADGSVPRRIRPRGASVRCPVRYPAPLVVPAVATAAAAAPSAKTVVVPAVATAAAIACAPPAATAARTVPGAYIAGKVVISSDNHGDGSAAGTPGRSVEGHASLTDAVPGSVGIGAGGKEPFAGPPSTSDKALRRYGASGSCICVWCQWQLYVCVCGKLPNVIIACRSPLLCHLVYYAGESPRNQSFTP